MLKELRNTFDDSGRDLGITFTAPSSYWYMRWFDLPGMLKYADWMNLVSGATITHRGPRLTMEGVL